MRILLNNKKETFYTTEKSIGSMKKFMLILVIMLSLQFATAVNIKGGDIYLFRPDSPYLDKEYVPAEYLSVEDLVFYTCIEEQELPVKTTVICLDDNSFKDLELVRWLDDENCYMGTYNLGGKDCRDMIIQSEYIKDEEIVTLEKKVRVNRLTSILDLVLENQYSDGGWKNSVDTAAGIWVLSNYPDIFDDELSMATDWLKLYRNNDYKCWPNDDCSVRHTAKIMAYITQAKLNLSTRVMHDGIVYLENMQNYYSEDEEWNMTLVPLESGSTSCIVSYEGEVLNIGNFTIAYDEEVRFDLEPVAGSELIIICDQTFKGNLTTPEEELVYYYEGDNMTYTMPENCWSNDHKWGDCDLTTTLFASMTPIDSYNKELALEYLEKQEKSERSGEKSIGRKKNVSEAALYAYLTNNTNVTSWLRYKQNNEGSWGNDTPFKKIYPTGYALLGLLESGFNRTHEVIDDAEVWVNEQEVEFTLNITQDYIAWNSTEQNALAFIVLKNNAKPIIKSSPMLILVDRETQEIELYNPTTFDLTDVTFEFSEDLQEILEIEEQSNIPSYSYVKQTLTKTQAETGNIFGHMLVKNFDKEIGKVPIMITNFPKIEISTSEEEILVFGKTAKINFAVSKTGHTFSCTLEWVDTDASSQSDYSVEGETITVDVSFDSAERVEKTYTAKFDCNTGDDSFELRVPVKISRYSRFPFTVTPESVFINQSGQNEFIIIENNLDETLDVEIKFLKAETDFELSRDIFSIDPNTKANVSIYNNIDATMNITKTNVIEVSALKQKKEVNLRAVIKANPPKEMNPILYWIIIFVITALVGVGGYFLYKYWDIIVNFIKKGSKIDEIKIKIKKLEEKEKQTAIMNMINILRILKKDDIQVRARLKEEEFTDAEIDAALASAEEGGEEEPEDDGGMAT